MLRLMIAVFATLMTVASFGNDIPQHSQDAACLKCHSEVLLGSQRHFPRGAGDCTFCHGLATSENETSVMRTYGESACLGCHQSVIGFKGGEPHDDMECSGCHNPHSSNHDFLLVEDPIKLCSRSCHGRDELGRSHPLGGQVVDFNTGGVMTCTSTCHRMHRPRSKNLLLAESTELCRKCHAEKF